jgi:hypothetical protein
MGLSDSNTREGKYSDLQARHMLDRIHVLRNAQPSVQLDLSELACRLTAERARVFANQALGRRLPVIERAVLNVFRIYPPDRQEFLLKDETTDLAIQLHAFAINVYAVLDNIAWVCALEAGLQDKPATAIGAYKPLVQPALPQSLREYLSEPRTREWFNNYGKVYRDSTAHRIPPYVPPRVFTAAESSRWQELHEAATEELTGWRPGQPADARLARHEALNEEKERLGRNSILMGLTLDGEDATAPVYIHPQMLSDWGLVHELVLTFTKGMRIQYGWNSPQMPPTSVGGLW